MKIGKNVPQIH
jgi:hypothetical protein